MTKNEQLAKLLGLEIKHITPASWGLDDLVSWGKVRGDKWVYSCGLPDWQHDLNEIHKIEMGLTEEQQVKYASELAVWSNTNMFEPVWDPFRVATAPSEVRIDALIKVLGGEG